MIADDILSLGVNAALVGLCALGQVAYWPALSARHNQPVVSALAKAIVLTGFALGIGASHMVAFRLAYLLDWPATLDALRVYGGVPDVASKLLAIGAVYFALKAKRLALAPADRRLWSVLTVAFYPAFRGASLAMFSGRCIRRAFRWRR